MSLATTFAPSPLPTLDLRTVAPGERHPQVFGRFEALRPGESLELVNDHDPQPLRLQFQRRFGSGCAWVALESGPALWRVQLTRTAAATPAPGTCCSGGACCG